MQWFITSSILHDNHMLVLSKIHKYAIYERRLQVSMDVRVENSMFGAGRSLLTMVVYAAGGRP